MVLCCGRKEEFGSDMKTGHVVQIHVGVLGLI